MMEISTDWRVEENSDLEKMEEEKSEHDEMGGSASQNETNNEAGLTVDVATVNITANSEEINGELADQKFKALEYLINQSKLYSAIILSQMQRENERIVVSTKTAEEQKQQDGVKVDTTGLNRILRRRTQETSNGRHGDSNKERAKGGRERKKDKQSARERGKISDYFSPKAVEAMTEGSELVSDALRSEIMQGSNESIEQGKDTQYIEQPKLMKGGVMRTYQLEGLEWLVSLYENGLNGILADEMGLGKTIQTIGLLAFLWERQSYGPFLIVAPLSTSSNWIAELQNWAPDVPSVLYHGDRQQRAKVREDKFQRPGSADFPIVITSYEMCMQDASHLRKFGWKFIIIDEGHRIKNINCRLLREIQTFRSANRLLITGTPLQNNLAELWSLLHFLMPSVFDRLDVFESWFDFSSLKDHEGYEQIFTREREQYLVASLHAILKPFLLRRVKSDVEAMLPKKREYHLFAPMTKLQEKMYESIHRGALRELLERMAKECLVAARLLPSLSSTEELVNGNRTECVGNRRTSKRAKSNGAGEDKGRKGRRLRNRETFVDQGAGLTSLLNQRSDINKYDYTLLNPDELEQRQRRLNDLVHRIVLKKKMLNSAMQLRLVCNSPYNFLNPGEVVDLAQSLIDSEEHETDVEKGVKKRLQRASPCEGDDDEARVIDESLIVTSGKMLLLDTLLPELLKRGHKVLIFSQFCSQLNLIQAYACQLRAWKVSRIDGGVSQSDRQRQIDEFNGQDCRDSLDDGGKYSGVIKPGQANTHDSTSTNIFLLSTRAGGQGINLTAADTVILFDSDWNPQADIQAQDRIHRIGQRKNVIIYRFLTKSSIEKNLVSNAAAKRRLEQVVIQKGGLTRTQQNHDDHEHCASNPFSPQNSSSRITRLGNVFSESQAASSVLNVVRQSQGEIQKVDFDKEWREEDGKVTSSEQVDSFVTRFSWFVGPRAEKPSVPKLIPHASSILEGLMDRRDQAYTHIQKLNESCADNSI